MNNTAHSCESQLLTINDLAVNLNNGGQTMLDFTKAFDKVFHELQVKNCSIRGNTLEWLKFFTNRTQQVIINGKT